MCEAGGCRTAILKLSFESGLGIKLWVAASLFKQRNRTENSKALSVISCNFHCLVTYMSVMDCNVKYAFTVDHSQSRLGNSSAEVYGSFTESVIVGGSLLNVLVT